MNRSPADRDGRRPRGERTSTEFAPWTLVEANDKRFARVKILRTVVERLQAAMGK